MLEKILDGYKGTVSNKIRGRIRKNLQKVLKCLNHSFINEKKKKPFKNFERLFI